MDRQTVTTTMLSLFDQLAPREGYTRSVLDGVRLMRADRPLARTPVLYEPSIVIVCQGRKCGFLGNETFLYDARHYLVLALPLPFFAETMASPEEPMLAVQISLDMAEIAELVLRLDQHGDAIQAAPCSLVSMPLGQELEDATLRLLKALAQPLEAAILAPAIVKEICFRVLRGGQGAALRAALAHHGQFGKVAKAINRIHQDYAGDLDVGGLAAEAGMSVPAFHAHFKAATRTSPIQYIKSTRLHQARLLMIRDGQTAAAAAAKVGYASPSQFNREFRRFFGRSPGEEKRTMAVAFALRPAVEMAHFVSPG